MLRPLAAACLGLLVLAGRIDATPVTITQTYGAAISPMIVNGGTPQMVAGDWLFRILTDTSNPDLDPVSFIGRFAASVTVSNSGLGLVDAAVTNLNFYFEWDTRAAGLTNQLWTAQVVMYGPVDSIGDSNLIELDALSIDSTRGYHRSFGLFHAPMILADGTTIHAYTETLAGTQRGYASPAAVATAPEPASVLLLGSGLAGVAAMMRRRRARWQTGQASRSKGESGLDRGEAAGHRPQ